MSGYCLDAGALIAIERGALNLLPGLIGALEDGLHVHVPAGALAQVWRGGSRQARLSRFVAADGVRVIAFDEEVARDVGVLCGLTGTSDVVDAHVAFHAHMEGLAVITSDPDDLRAFGPLEIVTI